MIAQSSKEAIEEVYEKLRPAKIRTRSPFFHYKTVWPVVLLVFSAMHLSASEQPSRDDVQAYIVEQMWQGFELGPFEYEIYPETHSGRVSVVGKTYLKEDLFLADVNHEHMLKKNLESLIQDEPGYLEMAMSVVRQTYQKRHHSVLPIFAIVNKKGAHSEFRGNLFYQKEIDGWLFSGSLQFAEPLGKMRSEFRGYDDAFIVLGSKEYDAVLNMALSLRNELMEMRWRLTEEVQHLFRKDNTLVLSEKVGDGDWNPLLVFQVRDEPSIERYRDYSRGFYSQRAEPFYVKGWGEVQSERIWEHQTFKKREKVFVEIRGTVIGWDYWVASVDNVLIRRSEDSGMSGRLNVGSTWDGERFMTDPRPRGAPASYPVRTTIQRLEAVSVQEDPPSSKTVVTPELDFEGIAGGQSLQEPAEIPEGIVVLASRGELTVRGLRAFGMLGIDEDRLVVTLRNRNVDILGVNSEELRSLLQSGGGSEITFSDKESAELRALLVKMQDIQERASLRN